MSDGKKRAAVFAFVGILATAFLAGVCWHPVREFLRIDRCLDRGGAWDYQTDTCSCGESPARPTNLSGVD
jgi:hypothetical protein